VDIQRAAPNGDAMVQERTFKDSAGLEWEVYDESSSSLGWALEWDCPPQDANPGLIFVCGAERRRLWPCPRDWRELPDGALEKLCRQATSLDGERG
jgi:hypothetical protein